MIHLAKRKTLHYELGGSVKSVNRWMQTRQAARYLGLSDNALRTHVYRGLLKCRKLGGRMYFDRLELDEIMSGQGNNNGNI